MLATALGLLPTQVINVYLGSTLRSMQDVLTDDKTANTGYVVFSVQVSLSLSRSDLLPFLSILKFLSVIAEIEFTCGVRILGRGRFVSFSLGVDLLRHFLSFLMDF